MRSKMMENIFSPGRSRIVMELISHEQLTTKELLEKVPEISQPTMYRHLKTMVADGTIKIVAEKQIRGTVEKSYSLAVDLKADIQQILDENDGEGYFKLFSQYIMSVVSEFKKYTEGEEIDLKNDGSGFTVAPVYATKEELMTTMMKVGEAMKGLIENKKSPERNLYNICLIKIPMK